MIYYFFYCFLAFIQKVFEALINGNAFAKKGLAFLFVILEKLGKFSLTSMSLRNLLINYIALHS